jgi:predicted Zn-dependent protease
MNKKWVALSILTLLVLTVAANSGCTESESEPRLGDYAKSYLQDSKYTRIIIEIDYAEGFKPSSHALETLRTRINQYCDKPGGEVVFDDGITTVKSQYTDDDIRNLEEEHRTYDKSSSDIVIYILYLDGEYKKDNNVLGIAYGASSIAVFKEKIDSISIPVWAINQVDSEDYEASVLVHEFGHLLALVNINYKSERKHESTNQHHCIHEECVMYHSVESASIINLVTQEDPKPPTDFFNDCKNDLSKLKSGHY